MLVPNFKPYNPQQINHTADNTNDLRLFQSNILHLVHGTIYHMQIISAI